MASYSQRPTSSDVTLSLGSPNAKFQRSGTGKSGQLIAMSKSSLRGSKSFSSNSINGNRVKNVQNNDSHILMEKFEGGPDVGEPDQSSVQLHNVSLDSTKILKDRISSSIQFIYNDGSERQLDLTYVPRDYSQLQREIARLFPEFKNLFIIQTTSGDLITSENFRYCQLYVVREFFSNRIPDLVPLVPTYWEFRGYHGCPPGWESLREKESRLDEEKRTIENLKPVSNDEDLFERKLKLSREKISTSKNLTAAEVDSHLNPHVALASTASRMK